ncbi:hypothetical protein Ccar_16300 [Clostridium carboxidivorans P7]|uniref:Uncharacterized protein n=1 Tax=Clostridium carboxidivorans P7 TaxID=536227 RepID=C6PT06_9CLOT|nr:hypothetical protein [Clostridium carboxidivorans]AKN32339.1 hypothetical protein Ccar_16300 [Clostridium carboxidivorans P7]EET87641.1 hypothetical protein CcarbDRAFT_1923 [Clostridium carboxidivorans P7]
MKKIIMTTEEEFEDECICAYGILNFVDRVESDVKWWFNVAYYDDYENKYIVIFKSYITEEYKDYILSIEVKKVNDSWEYKVLKKIDGLTLNLKFDKKMG